MSSPILTAVFIIIIFSGSSFGFDAEDLANRKIQLEIEQIAQQVRFEPLKTWVSIIGGGLGAIAILWTITNGIKAISQQTKEREDRRISSLIEALSSESLSLRLGAARGLSRYADQATLEVIAALATEPSPLVRQALEDTLFGVGKRCVSRVLKANSLTLIDRSHYLGRWITIQPDVKTAAQLFRLTEKAAGRLRRFFNVEYEYGQTVETLRLQRGAKPEDEQTEIADLVQRLIVLSESTGKVIARWLNSGRTFSWPESGLDLSETNLYRSRFTGIQSSQVLFMHSLLRHTDLSGSSLTNSDFSFTDLFNARMNAAILNGSFFTESTMRSVVGIGADFADCELRGAILSEGDFSKAIFKRARAVDAKFRGTKLQQAVLDNALLSKCEFQRADMGDASMSGARLFAANLVEANMKRVKARNAKFNGADLRGANLQDSNLENADFSGANLANADFRGAFLNSAKFNKCKGKDTAKFSNNLNPIKSQLS